MKQFLPFYTLDGSVGLYNEDYEDIYHSVTGAVSESYDKFILPADILNIIKNNNEIKLLDICFGIGYNSKSFLNFILKNYSENKFLPRKILSTSIDMIYTNNNSDNSLNIDTIYTDKNMVSTDIKLYNDKIYTNKIYDKDLPCSLHDKNKIDKIFINAIDIDKFSALISPFILTGVKNIKKYNKNLKNEKIKKLLEKYKLKIYYNIFKNNKNLSKLLKYPDAIGFFLLNKLISQHEDLIFSDDIRDLLFDISMKPFLSKNLLLYYKLLYFERYINNPIRHLFAFLHNIYYMYLSCRYKNDLKRLKMLNIDFELKIKDARQVLLNDNNVYNLIFLDGFTASKCPCLWSYEFIRLLSEHISDDGLILTYSTALPLRNAFIKSNLHIGNILDSENNIIGTIASKNKNLIKFELSEYDLGLLKTKSGIVYRDENLDGLNEAIIEARNIEVKNSNKISASEYKRKYAKA